MLYRSFGKRLLDIFLSTAALIVLSPLLLVVSFAIRHEDKGPAFFRQTRVGRDGKPFVVLKFRSMPVNSANIPSAHAGAMKITKIGKFIRRTNIDELPQLFNVLMGDMSIIGPRPSLFSQKELCALRERFGASHCTPGLTGLAQIKSYDFMPEIEKVKWDAIYCTTLSLLGDLSIIFKTLGYLRKPPPVY